MALGEWLIVALRWAHALAAIVWLGGGAYATLILGPRLREAGDPATAERLRGATGREFGRWVNASIVVFVVSGVLLTFARLAGRGATVEYGIVLALKVGLALWMFGIAQGLRERRRPRKKGASAGRFGRLRRALGSPRVLLWLGAIVVLLSAVLEAIYEAALRGS
ncbi:MAG: hypothetical protein M3Q65_15030 [Chloroflexota bacterium]|nr:hypothetical protein [Chloroflexota bacterium]